MKKIFSKEVIIGFTVLLTLLILFFGINYLRGINLFHTANYYYVSYTNVAGLAESAPVTVNGFKVGLVREIKYEYDNPGHILVELSLNKDLKVPSGSEAVLVTDLLGTSSIELRMATSSTHHNVGDKLIGVNSKGLMESVQSEMLPSVYNIMPHIDSLLMSANYLVSDPALSNSVRRLDNIMANLEVSTAKLAATMNSIPAIVDGAGSTISNVKDFSVQLNTIAADLTTLSAQLRNMPIDSTFNSLAIEIGAIAQNLNNLTTQLNNPDSSLGLLMHDSSLYDNLNNSAAHIDSLLIDLKRQPKRYIPPIKIF